jgi:hypothetical protein
VEPFTVSTTIDLPREQVFDYLADIANHSEFRDHYLVDWRLLREESRGVGAGVRFRIKAPLNRFAWGDLTFAEMQPPFRIMERGRSGKFNRIKMMGIWEIRQDTATTTRVEYTFETVPVLPSDHLMELIGGGRGASRRRAAKALRRLRAILEDGSQRGQRVAIAAR